MAIVCYRQARGALFNHDFDIPCGNLTSSTPIQTCCVKGDTCLSDGLCSYSHSQQGGSGYYVSACTAPSGPGCPTACNDQALPDAVFNTTSKLWQCCGTNASGQAQCDDPTNETFNAPGPDALKSVTQIPSTGWIATSLATSTAVSTSSITPTSSVTPSPSSAPAGGGLSTSASIGLGVGIPVVAIIVIAATAALLWQRKKSQERRAWYEPSQNWDSREDHDLPAYTSARPKMAASYQDDTTRDEMQELPSRETQELAADSPEKTSLVRPHELP